MDGVICGWCFCGFTACFFSTCEVMWRESGRGIGVGIIIVNYWATEAHLSILKGCQCYCIVRNIISILYGSPRKKAKYNLFIPWVLPFQLPTTMRTKYLTHNNKFCIHLFEGTRHTMNSISLILENNYLKTCYIWIRTWHCLTVTFYSCETILNTL
mgnify:CR=1 FL=1